MECVNREAVPSALRSARYAMLIGVGLLLLSAAISALFQTVSMFYLACNVYFVGFIAVLGGSVTALRLAKLNEMFWYRGQFLALDKVTLLLYTSFRYRIIAGATMLTLFSVGLAVIAYRIVAIS
ncbi:MULTISPECIES: hypothetical protein [Corallincola]|uniref:Uncharacterized protein n=2 Tax=Corallincola TaxID=1775176 RepID=A0ABY1WSR4_9GAMM|nr:MULTISPECIES: hypothetical protein [Corallincola]TAA47775.1 hypothetical protein EXY25_00550 [Corallincola spongiicola]TCI01494.1 hypothetical protein EZV61_17385 [Corallincola luteus]